MHQKLRHQLNIHKISGSYKTINFCILLTPSFFFYKKKQTCFQNKESSVDQACMVKTNLTQGERFESNKIEKTAARRAFTIIPI
jgi:hypothetical protein